MSELAERARGLANELEIVHSEHVLDKLEQALLAERRLAMGTIRKYLRHTDSCLFTFESRREACTCGLREAAAEKEVKNG